MISLSRAPTRRRRRPSAAHPPQVDGLRSLTKSDSATGSRYEDSSKTGKYRKGSLGYKPAQSGIAEYLGPRRYTPAEHLRPTRFSQYWMKMDGQSDVNVTIFYWMKLDEKMDRGINASLLKITNEILAHIANIDEFKGAWQ